MHIFSYKSCCFPVNPLHPNISMHILHTVLYTFPKVNPSFLEIPRNSQKLPIMQITLAN